MSLCQHRNKEPSQPPPPTSTMAIPRNRTLYDSQTLARCTKLEKHETIRNTTHQGVTLVHEATISYTNIAHKLYDHKSDLTNYTPNVRKDGPNIHLAPACSRQLQFSSDNHLSASCPHARCLNDIITRTLNKIENERKYHNEKD